MSLDLELDAGQLALADALDQLARDRWSDEAARAAGGALPRDLWSELAAQGVLSAGSPGGEGGALEICAAVEALGRWAFPGPLAETFLAMQVLDASEREAVADGRVLVACGTPPLLPFAPLAGVFLTVSREGVHRAEPTAPVEPVEVLGGEPWGRVPLRSGPVLPGSVRAVAVGDMARAAQLAALAQRLVDDAAEHARTRRQFGRAIGEFQAVAHPLADSHMRLAASRALARAAAWSLDAATPGDAAGEAGAARRAASARLSASAAAVGAAEVAHQVYGAVGITLEGPAFHRTRRIQQLASGAAGAAAARARMLEGIGLAAA